MCLLPGHRSDTCRFKEPCFGCGGKHNYFLCTNQGRQQNYQRDNRPRYGGVNVVAISNNPIAPENMPKDNNGKEDSDSEGESDDALPNFIGELPNNEDSD